MTTQPTTYDLPAPNLVGELPARAELPKGRTAETWVSYSSITQHRRCPQQWTYQHLRGLRRTDRTMVVERELGIWWHALMSAHALVRGRALDSLRYSPSKVKLTDVGPRGESITIPADDLDVPRVIEQSEYWWRSLESEAKELWLEKVGQTLDQRLVHMLNGWETRWAEELPHEAPLAVEMGFGSTLPGGSGATVPGYVDSVYLDTRRGFAVIRDYKTSTKLDAADSASDMMDSQLPLYAWAIRGKVSEWGHDVRALAYDRSRSTAPKTPQLTQAGALSKSVTDYDLSTYLAWAAGPDGNGQPWGEPDTYYVSGTKKGQPKFGTYTAEQTVVDKLSDPAAQSVWFQRSLIPWNDNLIRSHLRAAVLTQQQMVATATYFDRYGESPRSLGPACRYCDFAALCRAEMLGGPGGEYPLEAMSLTDEPRAK